MKKLLLIGMLAVSVIGCSTPAPEIKQGPYGCRVSGPTVSGTDSRYVAVFLVTGFREKNDSTLQFLDTVAANYLSSTEESGSYTIVFDEAHTRLCLHSKRAQVIDDILGSKKHVFEP